MPAPPPGAYQPLKRRRRRPSPPVQVDFNLGHSLFWYAPGNRHLSLDLEALAVTLEFHHKRKGLHLGYNFKVMKWRIDRWFQAAPGGDVTLSDWEFAPLMLRLGGKRWWIDVGFLGGRMFQASLPLQRSQGPEGPARSLTFESPGGMFVLPRLQAGVRFGFFHAQANAELLHWDLSNYRLGAEISFQVTALQAKAGVRWQRDRLWLQQHKDEAQEERLWLHAQRQFMDTYLEVEVNLGRLLPSLKALRYGPIVLHAGARYRRYQENRLVTEQGITWFAPGVREDWSFSLGLRVAWGIKSD